MKRFPYILCIVFPVFVWACHTSRQTIGEARENRVHSIDRDLHVVIDSLCRNDWSGLTEWAWTHVDVFDSMPVSYTHLYLRIGQYVSRP